MNGIPVSRNVPNGKGVFQSFRECCPGMNGSKFKECSRVRCKSKVLGNVPKEQGMRTAKLIGVRGTGEVRHFDPLLRHLNSPHSSSLLLASLSSFLVILGTFSKTGTPFIPGEHSLNLE